VTTEKASKESSEGKLFFSECVYNSELNTFNTAEDEESNSEPTATESSQTALLETKHTSDTMTFT
jgi:hypothetical protein